jgi:hypothetical protein
VIGTAPHFGEHSFVLWEWAAGMLAVFLLVAIILTGISFMKRLFR